MKAASSRAMATTWLGCFPRAMRRRTRVHKRTWACHPMYGGGIAHVITHSMHHRAQPLYMLRRLGIEGLPEGDVLSWEQPAGPA